MFLERIVRPLESPTPFTSRRIITSVPADPPTSAEGEDDTITLKWGAAGSIPAGVPQPEGAGGNVNFQVNCCETNWTQWHVPEYEDVRVHPKDDPETWVIERRPKRIILKKAENWCTKKEKSTGQHITIQQMKGCFTAAGAPMYSASSTKGQDDCQTTYGYAYDYGTPIDQTQTVVNSVKNNQVG